MCGHAEHAVYPVTMPDMALFGMVWLLRMRAEMRRCAKCRREEARWLNENAALEEPQNVAVQTASGPVAPIFTVESACSESAGAPPPPPPAPKTPRAFCEVHGYRRKQGELYPRGIYIVHVCSTFLHVMCTKTQIISWNLSPHDSVTFANASGLWTRNFKAIGFWALLK